MPPDNPDNALVLGKALHTGIEKGLDAALSEYLNAYPIASDEHFNEAIKLEYWIPRAREMLPEGEYEAPILHKDFIGYIDLLAPVTMFHDEKAPNLYDLYDFKYTANGRNYADSPQLHLYKYFFELTHPGAKIRNLIYFIIPKVGIKQKKGENLRAFRERIESELSKKEITTIQVDYNPGKVIGFLLGVKGLLECKDYPKEPNYLCNWCEYQEYCQKGVDYMLLPKSERRCVNAINKKVIWLYGAPFTGKTFFANKFPVPLMLNTDGNIRFVDSPYIPLRDKVEVNGRMTKRTMAWEVFKEVLNELEKKENDFQTIIIDLVEDLHESCRVYMYKELGITHESDDSFRAWDKVRTEFLSTMRRATNMDYENILLISHEDITKDITRRDGKLTAIKPNIQEKVANKIAGMVDIVARVTANGDKRLLSFKNDEVTFGGGRFTATAKEIPLDYDAFCAVYDEANRATAAILSGEAATSEPTPVKKTRVRKSAEEPIESETETVDPPPFEEPAPNVDLAANVKEVERQAVENVEMAGNAYLPVDRVNGTMANDAEPEPTPIETVKPPRTRKKRGE